MQRKPSREGRKVLSHTSLQGRKRIWPTGHQTPDRLFSGKRERTRQALLVLIYFRATYSAGTSVLIHASTSELMEGQEDQSRSSGLNFVNGPLRDRNYPSRGTITGACHPKTTISPNPSWGPIIGQRFFRPADKKKHDADRRDWQEQKRIF